MNSLDLSNVFLSSIKPDTRTIFYLSTFDKYFTAIGLLSHDEMSFYDSIEREWKETQPDYSWNEAMIIFPEAKRVAAKCLKDEIKQCKSDLLEAERVEREIKNILDWRCSEQSRDFWEPIVYGMYVDPLRNGKEQVIKRNTYRLSTLTRKEVVQGAGVDETTVLRAKQVPIINFVKVIRDNKAVCIFHSDKSPSMHIYKDNHFYCFTCHHTGDVVDIVMKLNNVDFVTAVKSLV